MAITDPPSIPQRGARSTFAGQVDAFIKWLAALPAELRTFLAELSTVAAGGANSFSYTFDASTGDIDPGPGKLRLSSINQNSATTLRIDPVTASGSNITGVLAGLLAGTNGIKGSFRLQKRNDPSRFLIFDVSSGSGTGYTNLTLAHRASSHVAPFVEGDSLMVFIDRNGDKGGEGNADKKVQVAPAPVNGIVTVSYLDGNCLVWNPTGGSVSALNITNWPPAGTLGEFWIEGNNLGAATVNTNFAVNWVRPDGTYANNTSINTNHGAALRPTGEDTVLLWGRSGAPQKGKVVR